MFYNINDELLFVGKARKIRQRIKKHFRRQCFSIKNHRDEVYRIDACIVEDQQKEKFTKHISLMNTKQNITLIKYSINKQ